MSESFTKAEISKYCAEQLGVPKVSAERMLDMAIDAIRQSLFDGYRVQLGSIGSLERIATPARKARNPLTGEVIDVQARHRIKFRASKGMRG